MGDSPPRLELYLRSLAPTQGRQQQDFIVERLQALDETDEIRGFEVVLCGDCVCPESVTASTDPGQRLLDRYQRFEQWADESDRDLTGFEHRNTTSLLTGTEVTGIVFPKVVLAEFTGGDLTFVSPSNNGDDRTTVSDHLNRYDSD